MKTSNREKIALRVSVGFIRAQEIISEVCDEHGVPRRLLLGPRRSRTIVYARQLAMAQIKNETELSLPEIGEIFGKDHTTVLFACRKYANQRSTK